MPFDTTYHIAPTDKTTIVTYKVSGGKDIDIYLDKDELPPGIDSFPNVDELLRTIPLPDIEQPKKEEHYIPGPGMVIAFIAIFIFVLFRIKRNFETEEEGTRDNFVQSLSVKSSNKKQSAYITYYGDELNFSDKELTNVLTKRFPYFNSLSQIQKARFLERLHHFIASKIFKIHDKAAYKEMPILISAAAVQLTFGLKKYLLPNFDFIHVYPQEFMRVNESICFLEGNVSGHSVNLSWKHFLQGYANPVNGQNVGLHEFAHALYYQTFVVEENVDHSFRDTFDDFSNHGNKVFNQEAQPGSDLYSDYALKNFQEFWAESTEIFFEKPAAMKAAYPQLYDAMQSLLNQDPFNRIASVIT
ncbi:zinc-dependent peptidase [Ferruginibacter sp.]|nr:hypothetical protein [Ferruginibacter sp.]